MYLVGSLMADWNSKPKQMERVRMLAPYIALMVSSITSVAVVAVLWVIERRAASPGRPEPWVVYSVLNEFAVILAVLMLVFVAWIAARLPRVVGDLPYLARMATILLWASALLLATLALSWLPPVEYMLGIVDDWLLLLLSLGMAAVAPVVLAGVLWVTRGAWLPWTVLAVGSVAFAYALLVFFFERNDVLSWGAAAILLAAGAGLGAQLEVLLAHRNEV